MINDDINESIPEVLYIPEQDLTLVNEAKPYFRKSNDLYVVIAREFHIRNGINAGDLRVGIIKMHEDNTYSLVLPFCKNIIYATIEDNIIKLTYVEDKHLKSKELSLNSEGKLDYEEYEFLLDKKEDKLVLSGLSR